MVKQYITLAAWLIGLLVGGGHSTIALARTLYTSGMRQGISWQSYLLSRRQVSQNSLGGVKSQVYVVEVETQVASQPVQRSRHWVHCSTRQPFVAFPGTAGMKDWVIIHYLNPGGEYSGYNTDSHRLYWAVCHNMFRAHLDTLGRRARDLGYPGNLPSDQREVPLFGAPSFR
ncbi:MAG: hypothetical protein NZ772_02200 [Cyanobacteria bacterium]|nr:hypothetical protein [Cyanobacteriota bacterium]MDW8199943.1 hypothetical protein [Cyanobacteriota bacterium SKYGB_h_bin112]